jgi:hypothetical protein
MAKKFYLFLFISLAAISGFAQTFNSAVSCNSPLRTLEDGSNPPADTDDGSGSLQVTINCTAVSVAGASGYMSGFFYSNVVTLQHDIDVSFVNGYVVNDGKHSGWTITLEVTLPSAQMKRFKIPFNSTPPTNNELVIQWPILLHLPAGTKLQSSVYVFADNAATCSATCYGSAQWSLQ